MAQPMTAVRDTKSLHADDTTPTAGWHRVGAARGLGAVSAVLLLAGGYVHLCLYRHGYKFIPKVGVSFLVQAVSSLALAALLLRAVRRRRGTDANAFDQLTRLFALGLSLGTLAALGVAHTHRGLFEFHEVGLRPAPQSIIAIGAESLATLLLAIALLEGRIAGRHRPGRRGIAPSDPSAREVA